jgi:DNA-3-methyladenine glycosylase II
VILDAEGRAMTHTVTLMPQGPFSLAASTRFLEGFAPAAYLGSGDRPNEDGDDELLRLAFPLEGSWDPVGVAVRQKPSGHVVGEFQADVPVAAVRRQVARILSLDVDGRGFAAVGARDPVVGRLQREYPGLRPVCFHSPYEAAAWTIIGQRLRIVQAARIKANLAEHHGTALVVAGQTMHAFPDPHTLLGLRRFRGLNETKIERLHGIARAALDGVLDGDRLRSMAPDDALASLEQIAGIGPFSSSLILVRGAGAPDVFPRVERRLQDSMVTHYGLDKGEADADAHRLDAIAQGWAPYRSWVALLMRTEREDRTGEITGRSRSGSRSRQRA